MEGAAVSFNPIALLLASHRYIDQLPLITSRTFNPGKLQRNSLNRFFLNLIIWREFV